MSKKRAASGAVIGLALTASGVFAASNPNPVSVLAQDHSAVGGPNDNHGGAVSALAKTTGDAADTSSTTDTPTTGTTDTSGAQGTHGAAVSAVAQDQTAVGGTNDNHGGAVSAVARGTHGQSAIHGKSAGHSQSAAHRSTH